MSRRVSSSASAVLSIKPLIGALAAALLACSTAHGASFGHSRITSALGQPLRIDVPVKQLTADDMRSLQVSLAPAAAWAQAGLTPPVDFGTLKAQVADGFIAGSKVIQVRSSQPFDKPVADLLLDVRTASGQQRYQVSLLTHSSAMARTVGTRSIRVQQGDTMFAIAQRHAVPGVTVYQMMVALQRANPKAFIENNLNLVKAGSTLSMPSMAQLTAISDQEARRIFRKQAQAFALYRQRLAGRGVVVDQEGSAAKGVVSSESTPDSPQPDRGQRDQLRLSGSPAPLGAAEGAKDSNRAQTNGNGSGVAGSDAPGSPSADALADDRLATRKGIEDSEARVSQLEQNVKDLNQALLAQGEAAKDLLVDGARGLGITLPGLAGHGTAGSGSAASSATAGSAGSANGTLSNSGTGNGSEIGSANGAVSNRETGNGSGTVSTNASNGGVPTEAGTATGRVGGMGAAAKANQDPGSDASANGAGTSDSVSVAAADTASGAPSAVGPDQANGGDAGTAGTAKSNSTPVAGTEPGRGAGSDPDASGAGQAGGQGVEGTNHVEDQGKGQATNQTGGLGKGQATSQTGDLGNGQASRLASGSDAGQDSSPGDADQSAVTPHNGGAVVSPASKATSPSSQASTSATTGSNRHNPTINQPSASGSNGSDGVAEPISSKAETTVSWIQEHMLGVITGLLALVVLIIAWILRRANAHDGGDHGGLVTEAMVKEKLDQINLDLDQATPDDPTTRRR